QFRQRQEYARVDPALFAALLQLVFARRDEIDALMARHADRDAAQIDPVERSILCVGLAELIGMPETPYRVIINEAVLLAHRFGAEDGHKYINALLDKAATDVRSVERAAREA
ncbi:MAG: transcription antitermination factor NusB, partial [Pseudomonadota bacterium]